MKTHHVCGMGGLTIAYASLFFSMLISPSFNWYSNSLSDFGVGKTAMLFNSGMIVAGVLLFAFSTGLFSDKNTLVGRIGCTFLMLSVINLALIGIFPKSYVMLHPIVSTMFFLSAWASSLLMGISFMARKKTLSGKIIILSAIIFAVVWILPIPIAMQELFSSLMATIWVAAMLNS